MAKTPTSPARPAGVGARVDAWLLGAFLLVFAGAIATSAAAGSAELQEIQAGSGKSAPGSGATENPPRDVLRAVQSAVRALLLKSFGKDLVPVHGLGGLIVGATQTALPLSHGGATSARALAFQARAPPHLR